MSRVFLSENKFPGLKAKCQRRKKIPPAPSAHFAIFAAPAHPPPPIYVKKTFETVEIRARVTRFRAHLGGTNYLFPKEEFLTELSEGSH